MTRDVIWTADEVRRATGGSGDAEWSATGVSIDSRTVEFGDLFVALEGPNMDGHAFVADALERGASAAIVARQPDGVDAGAPLITVDDTQTALEALAVFSRDRVGAHICAVTGSVGKTGTKEALRLALERSGNTHVSAASYNNLWGVPLSLARMPRDTVYAVFEIGMNHAGEITPLTKMVRPHVAIVTTVEATHLEYFDSVEAIADAKAEIFEGLEPGGAAVLNRDNDQFDRLAAAANEAGAEIISFGTDDDSDVRLEKLALHSACSCVSADIQGQAATYKVSMSGRHWAMNSLAVMAAVRALGADVGLAGIALADMAAPAGRGRRHRVHSAAGTFDLIDDSYNASPASMAAAIEVLAGATVAEGGRRIAVLGDMRELGPTAPDLHAALAEKLTQTGIDLVFTAGELMSHLDAELPDGCRGGHTDTAEDLLPLITNSVSAGDAVLVKGSLASRMGLVVDALLALDAPAKAANG